MKLILFCLVFFGTCNTVHASNKPENNTDILAYVNTKSEHCKKTIPRQDELNKSNDFDNIFAHEPIYWKSYTDCLKNEIIFYLEKNYPEGTSQHISKLMNDVEDNYLALFRGIICPTWPSCPNSGEVLPYIHYFEFLQMFFFDIIKEKAA